MTTAVVLVLPSKFVTSENVAASSTSSPRIFVLTVVPPLYASYPVGALKVSFAAVIVEPCGIVTLGNLIPLPILKTVAEKYPARTRLVVPNVQTDPFQSLRQSSVPVPGCITIVGISNCNLSN